MIELQDQVRVQSVATLSDGWYRMRKYVFDQRRRDGTWQRLQREVCERGDTASVLLYDRQRGTVLLVRQFRLPAYTRGDSDGVLLELAGGLVGDDSPIVAARREVREETGYELETIEPVVVTQLCPPLVTERAHLFVAEVHGAQRTFRGGGVLEEGEDVELVELPFEEALARVASGVIVDAKTILLLYHARVANLFDA